MRTSTSALLSFEARFPFPYNSESFHSGFPLAASETHIPAHQPQMTGGMTSTRVPLPGDVTQEEITYVNARQYNAILRRRQQRARLEAQNKNIRNRKPYLHESRHLHALKRARGAGGRFLNSRKLQESKRAPPDDGLDKYGSAKFNLSGNMSEFEVHHQENYKDSGSPTSGSDVTSASNSEYIFQQTECKFQSKFRFFVYPSHISGIGKGCSGDSQAGENEHHLTYPGEMT